MSVSSMVMGMAFGSVGTMLARWWRNRKDRIQAAILDADNALERRLHIDFPEPVNNFYDSLVMGTVTAVDSFARNPTFWKNFIKFAQGRPDVGDVASKIWDFVCTIDFMSPIDDQIPDWLKPLYNEFKEHLAFNVVSAKAKILGNVVPTDPQIVAPSPAPVGSVVKPSEELVSAEVSSTPTLTVTEAKIRADIRNAVVVAKVTKRPITEEELASPGILWNRLIEESRKRQEMLRRNPGK